MADYHDAMGGIEPASPRHRMPAGSVAAAIALYLNSADFSGLAPATRADRLRILTSLARTDRGELPFARMESQDVERLLAEKAAAPHAAKSLLKALRSVAKTAVKLAVIAKDPTTGAKVYAPTSKAGFKMWEESDIAQFEARWPVGSRERLAFALLLYTGQRRGDIIRMGRQHVRNNALELRQGKTGTSVAIPIHPQLKAVLASSATGQMTFLTTETGAKPSPRVVQPFRRCAPCGKRAYHFLLAFNLFDCKQVGHIEVHLVSLSSYEVLKVEDRFFIIEPAILFVHRGDELFSCEA
jgi:integrase